MYSIYINLLSLLYLAYILSYKLIFARNKHWRYVLSKTTITCIDRYSVVLYSLTNKLLAHQDLISLFLSNQKDYHDWRSLDINDHFLRQPPLTFSPPAKQRGPYVRSAPALYCHECPRPPCTFRPLLYHYTSTVVIPFCCRYIFWYSYFDDKNNHTWIQDRIKTFE